MKKRIGILFLLIVVWNIGHAQSKKVLDSLRHELAIASQDTSRVLIMSHITTNYQNNRPDSALYYGYKALALARQIKFPYGEVRVMASIGITYDVLGNFSKSIQIKLQAIKIAEENNNVTGKAVLMNLLVGTYSQVKDYEKALSLSKEAKKLFDSVHEIRFSILAQTNIGSTFLRMNQLDSALYYCQLAYDNAVRLKTWPLNIVLLDLGEIQIKKGNTDLALEYFRRAIVNSTTASALFRANFSIAQLYEQINKTDSCIFFAKKSLEIAQEGGFYSYIINANVLLSRVIEPSDPNKALQYNKMAILYKDSLYNMGKVTTLESFSNFDKQERQYEIEKAETTYRNQVQQLWIFSISGALISAIIIALVLYRNNKNKQKANALLKEQKEEVQSTLEKLESTQSQLIQSEKMASLGELTAGIAHEIQNPLNFVNNFSEVNSELIEELMEEVENGNLEEVKAIARDILENESKIKHHGQRAESIVKGMLQHSRTSTGEKELTNINTLCDEYLRLAYHGMRAKDKSFNAEFRTEFDPNLLKINVVPQDIGRVLLNLINNAFYAVSEKAARHSDPEHSEGVESGASVAKENYKPDVVVSARKVNDKIEISVRDNGEGIPEQVRKKIFQPFFTTKPTGQGTGLGLSLSYDIVKAHGGKLEISKTGAQGTTFTIKLPSA